MVLLMDAVPDKVRVGVVVLVMVTVSDLPWLRDGVGVHVAVRLKELRENWDGVGDCVLWDPDRVAVREDQE
jgi:hypothetical protein